MIQINKRAKTTYKKKNKKRRKKTKLTFTNEHLAL